MSKDAKRRYNVEEFLGGIMAGSGDENSNLEDVSLNSFLLFFFV